MNLDSNFLCRTLAVGARFVAKEIEIGDFGFGKHVFNETAGSRLGLVADDRAFVPALAAPDPTPLASPELQPERSQGAGPTCLVAGCSADKSRAGTNPLVINSRNGLNHIFFLDRTGFGFAS